MHLKYSRKETELMMRETKALNVLMVTPHYFPSIGGTETHVYEVGRRLANSGVKVTILTPEFTPSLPKKDKSEGMDIMRVQSWPPERDYCIAPEIYAIISRGDWDLVHCQSCHTFVPPIAMLAAKKAKIPYVLTFHSGGHSSRFRTGIRAMQWNVLRSLFAHASKLIGVSRFEADYFRTLLHLPEQQFSVIPNGMNMLNSISLPSNASTQPLIVSVGRLERYKGHQYLITALPKIREQLPSARLLIVGKGPYEAILRQLALTVGVSEHMEFCSVPTYDRQGMTKLLSQATLVTLLSEYEAHPIAIMEALALRRPVLVANTSGLRELAEQQLVRAVPLESTSDEIAAAVVQQIQNPLIPASLTLPTWEQCTQELQNVYTEVARSTQCVS